MTELKQEWINIAIEALNRTYVPCSHFPVGTRLVTESGKTCQNINIESASFGLIDCAECTAFFRVASEGEKTFAYLVATGRTLDPTSPCGARRQVMTEFYSPNIPVTLVGDSGVAKITTARTLLPCTFTEKNL